MSSSPLDGFEKARNKSLRTERNAPVLDAFRDDLSWGGLVDDFYVDLEYVLHKSGKRIHGIDSLAQTFGDKNLLLCAPAGYGKTASFKKIFIQNSTGKQRFHYVSATIFSAKRTILSNYDKLFHAVLRKLPCLLNDILNLTASVAASYKWYSAVAAYVAAAFGYL